MDDERITNPLGSEVALAQRSTGALVSVEQQRAIAEVQARMLIARANPRDPIRCMDMILQDCTRPSLAGTALYQYARGGTAISGPSIRLAETIARRWGNIAAGIKEISRQNGYSECVAYAWDLETGYYDERQFQVRHWRDTKGGGYQIREERDIYELIANMGQRRKRAVLLSVMPGDVVEAAIEQCEVTLKASADTSPEAIKKMIAAFGSYGVTKEQIEARCQCHAEAIRPAQLVQLRKIYTSLKDGISEAGDWFAVSGAEPVPTTKGTAALRERLETHETVAVETGRAGSPRTPAPAIEGVGDGDRPPATLLPTPDLPQQFQATVTNLPPERHSPAGTSSTSQQKGAEHAVERDLDIPVPDGDRSQVVPVPEPTGKLGPNAQEAGGQALLDRGDQAAALGTAALNDWWNKTLSAFQRGDLGARGRGKGPHYERWAKIAAVADAAREPVQAPEAHPAGDLLDDTERRVPQNIRETSAASSKGRTPDFDSGNAGSTPAAASSSGSLEIPMVHFAGKDDPRAWWIALCRPRLAQITHEDDLAWFLGDNETNLNKARGVIGAAEIDAAIAEQWRHVPEEPQ